MNRIYTLQILAITHIARGVGQKKGQNRDLKTFFRRPKFKVRSLNEMVLSSIPCVYWGLCFKLSNGSNVPNGIPGGGGSHLCNDTKDGPDPFSHFSMSPPCCHVSITGKNGFTTTFITVITRRHPWKWRDINQLSMNSLYRIIFYFNHRITEIAK